MTGDSWLSDQLEGSIRPLTTDFFKIAHKAMTILGSLCSGHAVTTTGQPGLYMVHASVTQIQEFLRKDAKLFGPIWIEHGNSELMDHHFTTESRKLAHNINFTTHYYLLLILATDNDPDVRLLEIPRSLEKTFGRTVSIIQNNILKVTPFIEYISEDPHQILDEFAFASNKHLAETRIAQNRNTSN